MQCNEHPMGNKTCHPIGKIFLFTLSVIFIMILDLGLPILNYFGTFSIIFTDFYGLSSFDEISGFNLINCYPVGRLMGGKLIFFC